MKHTPPTLSAQFAALRTSVPSGPVEGYWVLDSAIALICAALIRIFARLEHMVELWQAGALPTPTPRAPAAVDRATAAPVPRTPQPRNPTERILRPRTQTALVIDEDMAVPITRRRVPSPGAPSRTPPIQTGPPPPIDPTHGPPIPGSRKKPRFQNGVGTS